MTANKKRPNSLQLKRFEDQQNDKAEPGRPMATASGPNPPNAIYPPGCGPMQLVWGAASVGSYGSCVLGWQCDSFRIFESRQKAADWLRTQARRIETADAED